MRKHRRAFENTDKGDNMEALENRTEKRMGSAKARRAKVDSTQGGNWGDHYQFLATKSVFKSAVSKEKLTKRGLVSLSDYYLKVAHT